MEEELQYIDDFFQGKLSAEEARVFEARIASDPAFAANVAFYVSARQSGRDLVAEEKKKRFKELYVASNGHHQKQETGKVRRFHVARWAVAAAVVAGITFVVMNWQRNSPQQLANNYIENNYGELSVTMGKEDELQRAANIYNEGRYTEALVAFENIIRKDSSSFQAVHYAGIAALQIPAYDQALQYFRQLQGFKAQFANPAVLLQAVTLLKRNQPGDKELAKSLLQQVVEDDLDGKAAAEKMLTEMDD